VLLRADGRIELLDRIGTFIGLDGIVPFEEDEKQLADGDRLVFYTDGVVECEDEEGAFFGQERLLTLLQKLQEEPLERLLDNLLEALVGFAGAAGFRDDVSLVGIEFRAPLTS